MSIARGLKLLSLLAYRPMEFSDRARALMEIRRDRAQAGEVRYESAPREEVAQEMAAQLGGTAESVFAEPALAQIEQTLRTTLADVQRRSSIPLMHNGDIAFARLCYLACRLLKPEAVIETGVAHGLSSTFLLQALAQNGRGRLHSIDLPPLRPKAREYVGMFVPEALRPRWDLRLGATRRLLPAVARSSGPIGLFIHDSLHTYQTMRFELETIRPHLSPTAVVICDDIESNTAFAEFVAEHQPAFSATIVEQDKQSTCGLCVFHANP